MPTRRIRIMQCKKKQKRKGHRDNANAHYPALRASQHHARLRRHAATSGPRHSLQ
ncbi:hypothetical protein FA15DRAFT_675606 [Coprinopsis marcescibilis]|uniref:Uncharacterized protein n=1 Tax=Coprinopsis marcescibilis TaxID=230819 RepID=A0A5C3KE15_COPMA|nr:hypothetical protein FA15DRAFT_675606 [Coprinopsis marcescibilis]